jgi:hypothetical protein
MQNDDNMNKIIELLSHQVKLEQNIATSLMVLKDMILDLQTKQIQRVHKNPLNRYGAKCFSQTDEDGITLEILRRMGIKSGIFAEYGVGNGLENNTLILSAMGWKGFWVGGEELGFDHSKSQRLRYIKAWITRDNLLAYSNDGIKWLESANLDVISMDFDGNDIYFVNDLLSYGIKPRLFIVEYNAQFVPPIRFQIEYDPSHRWRFDNYFGAALTNFNEIFCIHGYRLVCCNAHTGANAFFVHKDYEHLFDDVPLNISDIYSPPRYYIPSTFAHRQSPKTVELLVNCAG